LDEWRQTFKNLGHSCRFATISGGEPFLRRDLPQILRSLSEYCDPEYLAIPTNGLMPRLTYATLRDMLAWWPENREVHLNVSVDHVNGMHDEIRGVKDAFSKAVETVALASKLKSSHPCLKLSVHTVVSAYNAHLHPLKHIISYFSNHNHSVDYFISEVAEQRRELGTFNTSVTPTAENYAEAVRPLLSAPAKSVKEKIRKLYYADTVAYLLSPHQTVPCAALRASAHITAWGDVVSCCIRWLQEGNIGNLRTVGYDLKKLWNTDRAKQLRKSISNRECACPMANAYYSSAILHPPFYFKMLKHALRGDL
jgi:MoaA/NifB/PqqE/SkfB family radical SAM enzyme